jgi:DNA-binding NarL/FixJ family response regulator
MSIRLLIADGQEMARLGIKAFLAGTEVEVVAEAETGTAVIDLARATEPDLVLMAVRMPGGGGLATLEHLQRLRPKLCVIMTATEDHPIQFARAHKLGADAFLLKGFSRARLIETIRATVAGEPFWNRAHLRRVTGVVMTSPKDAELEAPLTPRENDVLREMIDGQTNRQIAAQLGISYETVKEHVQHILRKIGVDDRTQAAVWAVRRGLV